MQQTTHAPSGSQAGAGEIFLQKARALAPVLRGRAAATGQARCIPQQTIQDFWDAGLWYLLKPKKFGAPARRGVPGGP